MDMTHTHHEAVELILALLRQPPQSWHGPSDIAFALKLDRNRVRQLLGQLAAEGRVTRSIVEDRWKLFVRYRIARETPERAEDVA
jgi:DNA-binding MarR family transcriptional regulator